MQIVVLNMTAGDTRVAETKLLEAIRAINRQIQEDFHPYWSITGRLRLDPAPTTAVNPLTTPPSIRGDAVIYIIDAADGLTQGLLGYHDRYNAGIPFGVVYTSVCDQLGEPWSVALSHEALELLADPDVNLLCKGAHPSPAENGRTVYHWVEVCDAVQTQRYEIDGVTVSNFVLPAYYSGAAVDGGARCDFLLTKGADGSVL